MKIGIEIMRKTVFSGIQIFLGAGDRKIEIFRRFAVFGDKELAKALFRRIGIVWSVRSELTVMPTAEMDSYDAL